jgi:uncharacterized membrane protein YfcA
MPIDATSWAACLSVIFLSGVLRGFSGFGFALAATPLLGFLLPPAVAIPIVLILQVGASLVGVRATMAALDRRSVLTLGGAAILATPAGVALLSMLSAQSARAVIALLTILSVMAVRAGLRFRHRPNMALTLPFGVAAGLFSGLCAMPGPPVILFYTASPLANVSARASMVAIFLLTALSSLIAAAYAGLITLEAIWIAVAGAPAMVVGTWAGERLFNRYHDRCYKEASLMALIGIAAIAGLRAFI